MGLMDAATGGLAEVAEAAADTGSGSIEGLMRMFGGSAHSAPRAVGVLGSEGNKVALEHSLIAEKARVENIPVTSELGQRKVSLSQGSPYSEIDIPLDETNIDTLGREIPQQGYRLIYRREGSAPGGRLNLQLGGQVKEIYPGCEIASPNGFDNIRLVRSSRSSVKGTARIVIVTAPDATYSEPDTLEGPAFTPVDLLGTIQGVSTPTYVTIAEDTQPTGAAYAGRFLPTGFKRLRIYVNGAAFESADIYPWTRKAGVWFENGQGLVPLTLPGSAAGYATRVFEMDIDPQTEEMSFEVRNLLPAGLTGLGFVVQGVA